jgi:hypothetical protein
VIEVRLPNGKEAVALLYDNMRWILESAPCDRSRTKLGSVVEFNDALPEFLN